MGVRAAVFIAVYPASVRAHPLNREAASFRNGNTKSRCVVSVGRSARGKCWRSQMWKTAGTSKGSPQNRKAFRSTSSSCTRRKFLFKRFWIDAFRNEPGSIIALTADCLAA